MDQSIFLMEDNFLNSNPQEIFMSTSRIYDRAKTEKFIVIYDPICCENLKKLNEHEDLSQEFVVKYYDGLKNSKKFHNIRWHQLDTKCSRILGQISTIIYSLDFQTKQIHGLGIIPIIYDKLKLYLFFHITPYPAMSDVIQLFGHDVYSKHFDKCVLDLQIKLKSPKKG